MTWALLNYLTFFF